MTHHRRATATVSVLAWALCAPLASGAQTPGSTQDTVAADTLAADSVSAPDATPPPEAVPAERAQLDEAIRSRLQAVFDRVESLGEVTVAVDAGVVRLEGTVLDEEARTGAEELARVQDGVLYVENRITESTSVREQLRPTWARLRVLGYETVAKLPLLLVALALVALAATLGVLVARWGGPAFLQARNPFLRTLTGRAVQALVVLAGIVVALDLLGATALVGAVAGTAGLAGLALGFAFKEIVENYLAGVLMVLRQPFAKNDHVVVEGFEGKVVRLTARETILMTLDGNHVRLPNALVFRSPMVNYSRNPNRRFEFDAGLGSDDDLARAREVGVATLGAMEGVLDDPAPVALVWELGDSTVTVRYQGWVDQREADFGRVRSEAIRLVKTRLEAEGLSLPSPELLVRTRSEEARPVEAEAPRPAELLQADVSVDTSVDEQIEEDRRTSDEPDLLEESG